MRACRLSINLISKINFWHKILIYCCRKSECSYEYENRQTPTRVLDLCTGEYTLSTEIETLLAYTKMMSTGKNALRLFCNIRNSKIFCVRIELLSICTTYL